MVRYRPTKEDKLVICRCASRASRAAGCSSSVTIQPGVREGPRGRDMNVRLISDDPQWNDTDLFDPLPWSEFVRGVELTPDGRALVDFYVYERNPDGDLATNVQAHIEGGRLVRVAEERKTLWERGA